MTLYLSSKVCSIGGQVNQGTIKSTVILLSLGLMLVGYSNCTVADFNRAPGNNSTSGTIGSVGTINSGNGEGYSGKTQIYEYVDLNSPCADLKENGSPLPNAQILAKKSEVLLIRDECRDVKAAPLTTQQYSIVADNQISYLGRSFYPNQVSELAVKAAPCPPGYSPILGAKRTNSILSPVELDNIDSWDTKEDSVSVSVAGGFVGMPSFMVKREQDASGTNVFLRLSQMIEVQPNTYYAYSFFARAGSDDEIRVEIFQEAVNTEQIVGHWNLTTGAAIYENVESLTPTLMTSSPISNGFFITYYFNTTQFSENFDAGFAPANSNIGSSIEITGIQFEPVLNYCTEN